LRLRARKTQALLAYLASPPGLTHSRDKLAALLWGERSQQHARSRLRGSLFVLRRALAAADPACLVLGSEAVTLTADAVDVDAVTFAGSAEGGDPESLVRAVDLYRGDLLEGLAFRGALFEDWLMTERARLRELAIETLAKLLAHQRATGSAEAALQAALRLLALDPLQEPVHRTLMRLYAELGRRGAALRQYQLCVSVLQRELGVEPEADTRQLYQEILRRRPSRDSGHDGIRSGARHEPGPLASGMAAASTPLIGRDVELMGLRQALAQARGGAGRFVAILGEAGVGKTRLIAEMAVEPLPVDVRVLLGRCYESDQILPFGPWVDALRASGVTADGSLLDELAPAWRSELARLLPEVARPGLPAPADNQLRLFESVARLLERLAKRQAVFLVLEDLHWADEMTLRLLEFVTRRSSPWRLLLVVTARDDEGSEALATYRSLQELGTQPHAECMTLRPLSRADTQRLTHAMVRAGSDAEAIARLETHVWAASEGNPFVAVETTRAFEEGAISPDARTPPLPQRVRQLITRRLERLSGPARELASLAAVIEREFDFALLRQATGIDEHATAAGVEELVRRHVLRGVEERLDFTHDRVRAVVYEGLLPLRRRLCHRRVGEALEGLYCRDLEPYCPALGRHFREGEVWDKAVAYLQRAAKAAVERSAYREALAEFEQALVALTYLPDGLPKYEQGADLHSQIRQALDPLGDDQAIIDHLRQAEALATTLGDRRRLVMALAQITQYHWQVSEFEQGLKVGERARDIAEALGEIGLVIEVSQYLGQIHRDRGDVRRAKEVFSQYVDAFDPNRLRDRLVATGSPAVYFAANLASCHAILGDFAAGIARGVQALRIAEEIHQPLSVSNACRWLAHVYLLKGDFEAAVRLLRRALELTSAWGEGDATRAKARLGYALVLSGHVEEGLTMLKDLRTCGPDNRRSLWPLSIIWLAEAYALAGRVDDAEAAARRALVLARHQHARADEAWALLVLAQIAARREPADSDKFENHCFTALALASELGMRPLVAHCHLGLGKLYHRTDKREQAQEHLATATTLYREMGMTYWLEKAAAEERGT